MSYIPSRDRLDFDDDLAAKIVDAADIVEQAAMQGYHDDECCCGKDCGINDDECRIGSCYSPGVFEVIGFLVEAGVVNPANLAKLEPCSTDVDRDQIGRTCRLDTYGTHQCKRFGGHTTAHKCRCGTEWTDKDAETQS